MSAFQSALAALRRAAPALVVLSLLAPSRSAGQSWGAPASGNELFCGVVNTGDFCYANWPSFGHWPRGTYNQYIYGGGLAVAGIVSADAGFAWAGDTVPAYFRDLRGTRDHSTPISNVYSSGRADDLAAWPTWGSFADFPFATGTIEDGDPFSAAYLGEKSASELDTWTFYWDGDPRLNARRLHPMGVAVEQRTMQWNGPEGLQSVIFIVYRITNVTNLPVFRDAIAAEFFDGDSSAVPESGWVLDSVFVGLNMDPDVTTDATENFTLLSPGFGLAGGYHAQFVAPEFDFRPDIFYPPFFADAPGIVASALVHAELPGGEPAETRIVSDYEDNSCFGCDGGIELWHQLSGHPSGLLPCIVQDPIAAGFCYIRQQPYEAKSYQSVGPWSLAPGQSTTVVYAIVAAPTVETPEITQGLENPPGFPALAPGCDGDPILPLERAAGWVSTPVCPTPGERVDPDLVETVPGSLLHRIQLARAFAANGFLVPQAPDAPEFHVIAGDTSVQIVWSRSLTENQQGGGDPYYAVASDSTSALYNPNYRAHDVEGYRIYRSIDGVNWSLLTQMDYDSTTFVDFLCETDRDHAAGEPCVEPRELAINDVQYPFEEPFIQYRPGDIVRSSTGQPIRLGGDTASAGYPRLFDTDVAFVYTDTDVRPGFRYHYQVRAFDVNSYRSGPSSLESGSATKSVVAQRAFAGAFDGSVRMWLASADGDTLDPAAPLPGIDAETGIFSGPMPPTNAITTGFTPMLATFLPAARLELRIDSVIPTAQSTGLCVNGYGGGATISSGACWRMHLTADVDGATNPVVVTGYTPIWDSFAEPASAAFAAGSVTIPADAAALERAGAPPGFLEYTASFDVEVDESIFNSTFEGQANRRSGSAGVFAGGSRWFDGVVETVADPARLIRVGDLTGVDTIWSPDVHHTPVAPAGVQFPASGNMQWHGYMLSGIARAADFRVTWQNGTITVEDVTHGVPVPFKPTTQQNWGFIDDGNGNGLIDWLDFNYVDGASQLLEEGAGPTVHDDDPATRTLYSPSPVVMETSTQGVSQPALTATGRGFGLYLNTQRFIFETPGGARPADGTVWTLRTYHGVVFASDVLNPLDPTGYQFRSSGVIEALNGILDLRPPFVPGLRVLVESTAGGLDEGAIDLARIHTVPDPFYFHSYWGADDRGRLIRFVNLPPRATIRIFSVAGVLVDVIHHDDPASGIASWDVRTRDGATPASGVYFYHVSAPGAEEHIGRFTIVTSGRFLD